MHGAVTSFIFAVAMLVVAPAMADPGDCGTIVVPTGIGVASGDDITSFNPLLTTSLYNSTAAGMMFQPLLWINGNTLQIDWSRSIASAVTTPDDGTTYDVKLRPWIWSDGVPVTSADVAYTWKLIQKFGAAYTGYGAGGVPMDIKSFKVVSPEEFEVVLKRRVNPQWFIGNGLDAFLPLPAHAWGMYSADQIYQNQSNIKFFSVVDGPLAPVLMQFGQQMAFVPNTAWPGGRLHFNRFVFKFVESDGATVQQVEAGELDMANVPMGLWNAVQHLPGIHIVTLPEQIGFNETQLNLRNPKVAFLRDVRVRQAIADAIDQKQMIELIDHGHGEEHWGAVAPAAKTFLSPEMQKGHYPVGYNPQRSLELLKDAGFIPGPDGIMQKDGKQLSFTYLNLTGDAMIEQMTDMMQAYLRKVGIGMRVRDIEFNQMIALLNNPHADWEAAGLGASGAPYPSGEDLFKTGSFENSGGYSDPMMDKYIDESTNDPGLAGLYKYETYASAQQPWVFMETADVSMLVQNRIKGASRFIDPLYNYYPENLSCTTPQVEVTK